MAHPNELLDGVLSKTWPARDPVAINVEIESPERRIGTMLEFQASLKSTCRKRESGLLLRR
jgi:hypothetical protein